ncbi:glutamate receptor 2.2 [Rhynchospora pubera]|uniref:Glutamate receptor n=1 Tax=Rhynchospora pubera TaxID=906938 RepID=A0AAV8HFM7_9POAL|nr:glutamate receptor 2.2 [Rhynchospora pubera]
MRSSHCINLPFTPIIEYQDPHICGTTHLFPDMGERYQRQRAQQMHVWVLILLLFHISIPASTQLTQTPTPFKVGLILDTKYPIGQVALPSIQIAIADFYTANPNSTKHLIVVQRDSSSNVLNAASAGESVHAILGPGTAPEAAVVSDLGTKTNIPIISFSVTSQSVAPCCFPFFVRAAPSDAIQVRAIAALIQEYGWRRVVPIYEDDDHGASLLSLLVDALDDVEAVIPYSSSIRFSATVDHISSELYRLQTLQTRVFVINTCVNLAVRILTIANQIGMMSEGYVWILTEQLTSLLGWIENESMQGVLGVSTQIPASERLNGFKRRWSRQFLIENPDADPLRVASDLSNYAVWAYDATWALALAAEHLGPLVNGELNMTKPCRIVNVVDGKARQIGVWTQNEGLMGRLRPVIWAGDSMVTPKGWDQPSSGKRLRFAVPAPIDLGFQSFLNLEVDKTTNQTTAKGFVLEMFEAAVRQLPYGVLFDYVPVEDASYDSLVEFIANGSYDGIVADLTITAERSMFVDFTLPYKQSGIAILALAVKDKGSKNTWVLVKPLKPSLWGISTAFFILTGIIIWFMEYPSNEEFRGPWWRNFGTIIGFSFSTIVYAHTERITTNFSRIVIIVWLFVVFILTSSYTANLSSMLTVKQLRPSVSDINDLKRSGANVGYLQRSFVKDYLLKLGFKESRVLPLKSPQQYAEALTTGRVAAIVDETPYLGVFLDNHCDGYQMSSEIWKTGGFGFAFQKGSTLTADLSRAILKITETDESSAIEQKWFYQDQSLCSTKDNPYTSEKLGFESFETLFWITGGTTGLCCVIALIDFYMQNKDKLSEIVADNPWKTSLRKIWELFSKAADNTDNSSIASSA